MTDKTIQSACNKLGLHPKHRPLGDGHHTDKLFTARDIAIGEVLGYFLGTLFADVDGKDSKYWYYERTSIDEWRRVARALRIHGLTIKDGPE